MAAATAGLVPTATAGIATRGAVSAATTAAIGSRSAIAGSALARCAVTRRALARRVVTRGARPFPHHRRRHSERLLPAIPTVRLVVSLVVGLAVSVGARAASILLARCRRSGLLRLLRRVAGTTRTPEPLPSAVVVARRLVHRRGLIDSGSLAVIPGIVAHGLALARTPNAAALRAQHAPLGIRRLSGRGPKAAPAGSIIRIGIRIGPIAALTACHGLRPTYLLVLLHSLHRSRLLMRKEPGVLTASRNIDYLPEIGRAHV